MTTLNITSVKLDDLYAHLEVTGTSENISGTVLLEVTDTNGNTQQASTTVNEDGSFSFDTTLSNLSYGNLSLNVSGTADRTTDVTTTTYNGTINYSSYHASINTTAVIDYDTGTLNVTGTSIGVNAGETVTIRVSDAVGHNFTVNTTVQADGTYALSNIDLSPLNVGNLTVSSFSTDRLSLSLFDEDYLYFSILGEISTEVVVDNDTAYLKVSGATTYLSAGTPLQIRITDNEGNVVAELTRVTADGTYALNDIDVSSLVDGEINVTVLGNDIQNNLISKTTTIELDIIPGSINTLVEVDNGHALLNITGTSKDIPEGNKVAITITDSEGNTVTTEAVVDGNGNYAVPNVDVSNLVDGELTVNSATTDKQGRTATDKDLADLDATAGAIDTVVEVDNNNSQLNITGTSKDIPEGNRVTITITDSEGHQITTQARVDKDGHYAVPNVEVSSLVDGELTVDSTALDKQGRTVTDKDLADLDTTAGTIDTVVEVDNNNSQLNITGTSKDIPEGNRVTITITDSEGNQVTTHATVDKDGHYTVPNVDVSSLIDGELTVDSIALDKQGRAATDKDLADLDAVAGTIDTIVEVDNDNQVLHLTGTSKDIPEGNPVTITITDSEGHQVTTQATVGKDGHYAVPNVDVSSLTDGELTINSSALDKQGRIATDKDLAELDIAYGSIDTHVSINAKYDVMYITGTSTDVKAGSKVYIKITDKNGHYINTSAVVDQQGNYNVGNVNISRLAVGELTVDSVAVDRSGHTVTDKDLADNVFDRYINAQRLSEVTINDSISASYPSLREWKTYKHNSVFDPTLGPMTDDNNDHINVQYYITNRTHISTYGGDDVVKIGTNIDNSTVNLGEGNNTLIVGAANWVDGYITNKAKVIAGSGKDYLSVRTNIDTSTVDLGDGDNTIHVGGYITGAYTDVITGAGNDILTVGTNIQSADINLGAGDNEIRVGGYIAGAQASITTYEGNDYLSVGSNVASASINLGDGDNTINIGGYVTAKASIITGAGDDLVTINSNVDGSTLDLGNGANNLHIGGYVTNSVINTGAEHDVISIKGQAFGNSVINTGAGNDDISVGSLGNAKINGGEGHDTLHITSMDKDISFSNVLNVEHIDLGEGTQWLKDVNYKNMVKAGVTSLHIEGDSSDWVALGTINAANNTRDNSGADKSAVWNHTGTETENGVTYNVYTYSADNNYQVYVDQDVNVY